MLSATETEAGLFSFLPDVIRLWLLLYKGDDDKILVLCNLSPLPQAIVIKNDLLPGEYNEVFTGNLVRLKRKWALSMKPWEYMVFELVEKK